VFPLVRKDGLDEKAQDVYHLLRKEFVSFYDVSGSIGRRYARQDEIGTPFCITIDHDSLKKEDVTIRDRDTTHQVRVKIKDLKEILRKLISGEIEFKNIN
jgi:glycyl-tRNA synthetase